MRRRADKLLGARLLLYWVVILAGIALESYVMNNGDAGTGAILAASAFVLGIGSWWFIGAVERLVGPRRS